MTHHFGRVAGLLVCALVLAMACGGSSFEASEGNAGSASGGTAAGGNSGETSGGAEAGSTTNGGSSPGSGQGGASDGGVSTNGGVSVAGTNSGGVSSGGAGHGGTGGAAAACNEDSDCVACAYPTAPSKTVDCYCASCAGTPLSNSACRANQAAWEANCSKTPIPCPRIACIEPPVPTCKSHMCVAK